MASDTVWGWEEPSLWGALDGAVRLVEGVGSAYGISVAGAGPAGSKRSAPSMP
jgi:hypothetical protein